MLAEIKDVRQVPGEGKRRWFSDDYLDLIVWYDGQEISGFQLCYDVSRDPRALTWDREKGYIHTAVDEGEDGGHVKRSLCPS